MEDAPLAVIAERDVNPAGKGEVPSLARWIIPAVALVLVTYVWFISAGHWITWPKTAIYDYYSNLASAFEQGQLYLEDEPSPQLLALPDPYRIGARRGIPHIWDATLYRGRYYLYWGPVPALLLLPVRQIFGSSPVPDMYLAFGFVVGVYAVLCLVLVQVWKSFFAMLPPWTLSLAVAMAGLAPPLTWMLNRPEVYEAAIGAGQFFLLGGLYVCFRALAGGQHPALRFAIASASFGLAVGSRTSQALPLLFVVSATAFLIVVDHRRHYPSWPWRKLLALFLPVTGAVLGLFWYNWARFGSIAEFGYRYQLTLLQLPKHYDEIFSAAYVLPNLYNYILNPFTVSAGFPPIRPQYGMADWGSALVVPNIYFSEAVTGLIFTFPFMILGMLNLSLAWGPSGGRDKQPSAAAAHPRLLTWLRATLLGMMVLELATLLVFFFATERYLADLVPVLTLLSSLGFWQAYRTAGTDAVRRRSLAIASVVLAIASSTCSSLLAISSYQERFRTFNPGLISYLNSIFQH